MGGVGSGRKRIDPARTEAMIAMYRQGITLAKIGEKFGVTRERVRQLIRAAGFLEKAGASIAARAKQERAKRERALRCMDKWDVDLATWKRCRQDGTIRRFESHRNAAKSRCIPFCLTFGQWLAIWENSGKAHLSGKGKGRYCMSRINDAGGYEVGNVHIQPCVENSREAVKKWSGKVKANRGVFLLYPGLSAPWLAKYGNKSLGYFVTEAEAVKARAEYMAANGLTDRTVGRGRGWTILKSARSRPYQMQGPGGARSYHATQEEAEAAYRAACEAYLQRKVA